MIRYKKYQNKNMKSACYGKWYGKAVHELVELDELVKHMAEHHCVFSEATIKGVLIEMDTCLRELLLEGKAVRLDALGIFRIGLETDGAYTAAKFTADNIKGVRLNLYLGSRFRAADLYKDAKFREAGIYSGFEVEGGEDAAVGNRTFERATMGDEPIAVRPDDEPPAVHGDE